MIRGVVRPIVTPFDAEDRIDYGSLRQVVGFLLTRGVDGLMVGGTTGEGMLLSVGERKALCNDVSPALLGRLLRAAPNLVGIKSSNPDLVRLREYVEVGGEGFLVFCGVDGLMLPGLALGAKAQVSGNSNVFPETFRALYEAFMVGDMERARSWQGLVNRMRAVFRDGVTPAYFKAGLRLRGVPAGRVRPPLRELSPEELAEVERGLGVLELI